MTTTPSSRRITRPTRWSGAVVVLLVALLASVVGLGAGAGAQSGGDARAEREKVRAEKAQVAAQVDAAQADAAAVNQALADLQADVAAQRSALSNAQLALDEAEAELARLDGEIAATEAEVAALRQELRGVAVAAYLDPPVQEGFGALDAESAEQAVQKKVFLDLQGGNGADVLDQLRGASARLEAQRADAEALRAEAEEHRAAVSSRAQQVEASYQRQASFAADVESRLNARLAEAQNLASLDASLSQQIASEEAAVAAQLAAAKQRQTEAAQAATAAQSGGSSGSSGGGSTTTTQPTGPVVKPPIIGAGQLATVGGITVASSIASNLQGLLGAASAAGFTLGGTGYRDPSQQIELRKQHCGTSEYAIWSMPPEQCSPATAIPGRSKHEQGLAVDFTCNGVFIQSTGSACYQWLAANAGSYGFGPLAGEPWHWSVGGG